MRWLTFWLNHQIDRFVHWWMHRDDERWDDWQR
jgi:hypothetical protein